jgi:cytochrome c peroxidase
MKANDYVRYVSLIISLACSLNIHADIELPSPNIDFPEVNMQSVRLGRLLFYDPVLSGNKSVACATCHHPELGTSDGLSLGLGDGAKGLGRHRIIDKSNLPEQRVARNSPALFNLGAKQFKSMFHDGRLEIDPDKPNQLRSPLGADMTAGFASLLSAQAMFPVLAADEMAGHYSESDVSKAVRMGLLTHNGGAWDLLAKRIQNIAEYRQAFDSINGKDSAINFYHISNAIADFISYEWRADNSPFDKYLRGQSNLNPAATKGMRLFYGKAECARCHSGVLQTDHAFHAIAMPQFGPGKTGRFEDDQRDTGRFRVTGNIQDKYKFRTPSLRNAELTAPYGHTGAYPSLKTVIRHHLDPVTSLYQYSRELPILPELPGSNDWKIMDDKKELADIASANELEPMQLSDQEVDSLVSFISALTDQSSRNGRLGIPQTVPSGLPVIQ